ncbi:MAG: SlyX family protein [PS1 clade bacterium]
MKQSIIDLEEKFAHLENTIEELNDVVFRQSNKIDGLEKIVKSLSLQISQDNGKQEDIGGTVIDDRPPHY